MPFSPFLLLCMHAFSHTLPLWLVSWSSRYRDNQLLTQCKEVSRSQGNVHSTTWVFRYTDTDVDCCWTPTTSPRPGRAFPGSTSFSHLTPSCQVHGLPDFPRGRIWLLVFPTHQLARKPGEWLLYETHDLKEFRLELSVISNWWVTSILKTFHQPPSFPLLLCPPFLL